MDPNMVASMPAGQADLFAMLATAGLVMNILSILSYLLMSWGLYKICQYLKMEHAWLAWVPLIQMYPMVKAGGKSGWWILWLILGFIFFFIPGLILYIILLQGISENCQRGGWTTVGFLFIPAIMFPVVGYKLGNQSYNPASDSQLV